MVETVGAIVGTSPAGEKMFDAAMLVGIVLEKRCPVGTRQPVEILNQWPHGVAVDLPVFFYPEVGDIGIIAAFLYSIQQFDHRVVAFAPADDIHLFPVDDFREKRGVLSAKNGDELDMPAIRYRRTGSPLWSLPVGVGDVRGDDEALPASSFQTLRPPADFQVNP